MFKEEFIYLLLAVSFFVSIWILQSYAEARAYNNITGANVSTWDAMFIDLRVVNESLDKPSRNLSYEK